MVANRKLGSGCTCVAVVIGGGDGIASTPLAVLVASAHPGPASCGTSATTRNRMPRMPQAKITARACVEALNTRDIDVAGQRGSVSGDIGSKSKITKNTKLND